MLKGRGTRIRKKRKIVIMFPMKTVLKNTDKIGGTEMILNLPVKNKFKNLRKNED